MAFTFDNQIAAGHGGGSSGTDSFTMGAGTHGILIVFVMALGANSVLSDYQVGTLTYNGVALTRATRAGASVGEANENLEMWYMVDPPSGAHNIVTTLNGTPNGRPTNWVTAAISYTSSLPLTVSGATNAIAQTGNAPSLTIATTSGDHAIAAAWAIQTVITSLSGGPANERQNFSASQDAGISEFSSFADADKTAVGSTTTLAWTSHSTQHWYMVGFSITETASVAATQVANYESLTSVAQTRQANLESLTPVTETRQANLESLASVAETTQANLESLTPIAETQQANFESAGLPPLQAIQVINLESLAGVAETRQANIESLAAVAETQEANFESAGATIVLPTVQSLYEEHDSRAFSSLVLIGGAVLPDVLNIDYGFAISTAPTATIIHPRSSLPVAVAEEASVEIWCGFRVGLTMLRLLVFGGALVDSVSPDGGPNAKISCVQDGGRKLTFAYNRNVNYNFDNVTAQDSAVALLDLAGVDNYFVDLPPWDIGTAVAQRVQFSSYGEVLNKVATVDGSPWYALPSGQVRVELRDPIPSATARRQYFSGELSGITETQPPGVTNPLARPRILGFSADYDRQAVANYIEVDGANITEFGPSGEQNSHQIQAFDDAAPGSFANGAPWITTPPLFQQFTYTNELIDTDAKAASTVARYLILKNRLPESGRLTIPYDPDVFLGETVQVIDPVYSGRSQLYFVSAYRSSISKDNLTTELTLVGGQYAGTTGDIFPFAEFTWKYQALHSLLGIAGGIGNAKDLDLGYNADLGAKLCQSVPTDAGDPDHGSPTGPGEDKAMVLISFDASQSRDFDGQIVSYAWSDDAGHSGSGEFVTFLYDPLIVTTAKVTLVVTDANGNTGTLTKSAYTNASANPAGDDPTMNDTPNGGGAASGECTPGGSGGNGGGGGGTNGDAPGGANGMELGYVLAAGAYGMAAVDLTTWNDLAKGDAGATGDFISVAAGVRFNDQTRTILFGTTAGEIVRSVDLCLTGSVVFQANGRVECIWFDTGEQDRIWAGTSTGFLYSSDDLGLTWRLWKNFGDGLPIYAIGTPPKFGADDHFSLWVFGGDTGTPSSLIRIDGLKTGHFISLPIMGALADAIALAGPGFSIRASSMNEMSSIVAFNGGLSPLAWVAQDPIGDPSSWLPATGITGTSLLAAAPGFRGDYLVAGDGGSFLTQNDLAFAAGGAPPSPLNQILWQGLQGLYLGAADGGLLNTTDEGGHWAYVRPNATFGTSWPDGAVGYQVGLNAGIAAPRNVTPAPPAAFAVNMVEYANGAGFSGGAMLTFFSGQNTDPAPAFSGGLVGTQLYLQQWNIPPELGGGFVRWAAFLVRDTGGGGTISWDGVITQAYAPFAPGNNWGIVATLSDAAIPDYVSSSSADDGDYSPVFGGPGVTSDVTTSVSGAADEMTIAMARGNDQTPDPPGHGHILPGNAPVGQYGAETIFGPLFYYRLAGATGIGFHLEAAAETNFIVAVVLGHP